MISGLDQLEAFAAHLDRLAGVPERAAKRCAPALLKLAQSEYAAGESPEGDSWDPLKQGAGAPLRDLTREITATADGSAVVVTTPDVLKYHQGGYWIHEHGAALREAQANAKAAKLLGDKDRGKLARARVRSIKKAIRTEGTHVDARRTLPRRRALPVDWGRVIAKAWDDEMAETMAGVA